jgi:hypothetical protein
MNAPPGRVPRTRSPRSTVSARPARRSGRRSGENGRVLAVNALWRTAPYVLAGILALAASANLLPSPPVAAPLHMIFIIAFVVLGIGATFVFDRASARPYWQVVLAVLLVEMPVIALQSSALRTPFVALGRGSAGPLLWMTFACLLVLFGLWVFVLLQQREPPENAALLLLLPALIVPATLGAGGELSESSSLAMFGEAALLAGVTIFLAFFGPAGWRPLIAIVMCVLQVVGLWLFGHGPVIGPDAGFISFLCLILVMLAALGMLVAAPVGAIFTRRFFQTVEEKAGTTTLASVPQRGARRRFDN